MMRSENSGSPEHPGKSEQLPPPLPETSNVRQIRDRKYWARVAFGGVLAGYLILGAYFLNWYFLNERVEALRLQSYGVHLDNDADCERSIAVLDKLLALRPDDLEALMDRARYRLALRRYEAAAVDYERVLTLNPAPRYAQFASSALGNIYRALGTPGPAREYYERALEYNALAGQDWNLSRCHGDLGLLLLELGDEDGARPHFERALELEPEIDTDAGLREYCRKLFNLYSNPEDQKQLAGKMLAVASTLELPARVAYAHFAMGYACRQSDELEQAESHLLSSLNICVELDNNDEAIGVISELVRVQGLLGRDADVHACYEEALAIAGGVGPESRRAETMMYLGDICGISGDDLKAEIFYTRALSQFRAEGIKPGVAFVSESLALLKGRNGDLAGAESYFFAALNNYKAMDGIEGVAEMEVHLGALYRYMGDLDGAASRLHRVCRQLEDAEEATLSDMFGGAKLSKNPALLEKVYRLLGNNALDRGDFDEAACYYQQRLAIVDTLEGSFAKVSAITRLGVLHCIRGELVDAEACYDAALDVAEGSESLLIETVLLDFRITLDLAKKDYLTAEGNCLSALTLCKKLNLELSEAGCYVALMEISKARGELEAAEDWLNDALSIDEKYSYFNTLCWRKVDQAELLRLRGEFSRAESLLATVKRDAEQRGYRWLAAEAANSLGQVYADQEMNGRAADLWRHAREEFESMGLEIPASEVRYCLEDLGVSLRPPAA